MKYTWKCPLHRKALQERDLDTQSIYLKKYIEFHKSSFFVQPLPWKFLGQERVTCLFLEKKVFVLYQSSNI